MRHRQRLVRGYDGGDEAHAEGYETRTLKPLLPLYISSVDSGNLAGHLLTLAAGLREQAEEKIFTPQVFAGLRDTIKVLQNLLPENQSLAELDTRLAPAPAGLCPSGESRFPRSACSDGSSRA